MSLDLEKRIERAFQDDVILTYPKETTIAKLTHSYTEDRLNKQGNRIDFAKLKQVLTSLKHDVEAWYHAETGKQKMDTFALGDLQNEVKNRFYSDSKFQEAFSLLGVNYDEHHKKIYIPWWNEIGAGEQSHKVLEEGVANSVFVPMHSFETQLNKKGLELGVNATSTDGLLVTSDNYIALGVRAGSGHPNTYHIIPAGYLQAKDSLRNGLTTIYQGFVEDELTPESGVTQEDIVYARPLSRVHDFIISNGGPEFIFYVQTELSKEQLVERWKDSRTKHKAEHSSIEFVPANPDAVNDFLAKNYKGFVVNKLDRKDSERYILHPAALALASYSGMPLSELKKYCDGIEH